MKDILLANVCQLHRFLLPPKFQKGGNQSTTAKEISRNLSRSRFVKHYIVPKAHEFWGDKSLENRRIVINKTEIKSDSFTHDNPYHATVPSCYESMPTTCKFLIWNYADVLSPTRLS